MSRKYINLKGKNSTVISQFLRTKAKLRSTKCAFSKPISYTLYCPTRQLHDSYTEYLTFPRTF